MPAKGKWRSFEEAREYARSLRFRGTSKWRAWAKTDARPRDIPSAPPQIYPDEWAGWGDWLGTGNVRPGSIEWRPFGEARDFARSLGFKSVSEWTAWVKTDAKPDDIPASPKEVYGEQWRGMGDWLGTGRRRGAGWRPFVEARAFARSLGLKSEAEWREYTKSGQKPDDIPVSPIFAYKDAGWKGYPDWLGTKPRKPPGGWRPFEEAREVVRTLNLRTGKEWKEYARSEKRPADIPMNPPKVYENEGWVDLADWLGIKRYHGPAGGFRPFEEAREYARSLGFSSVYAWRDWSKTEARPPDIPASPDNVYRDSGWDGYPDWLGTNPRTPPGGWRPFEEARAFVRTLGIRSHLEWLEYVRSGQKPDDIPANPPQVYGDKWKRR
jgi:Phage-integrase repeat unit